MGFQFHRASTQTTGTKLYDVHICGERIFYELGFQEATSQYARPDWVQDALSVPRLILWYGKCNIQIRIKVPL